MKMDSRTAPQEQLDYLKKGAEHLIEETELLAKLTRGKPLTVKVGFDPSAPDIHLGHTVVMRKMRHFQDLGHRVIFLIGDFTGLIGDPSGRKATRPQLTPEEVAANAETYRAQACRILDPDRTVIEFNSRWLGALGSEGWIRLAGKVTLARIMERDDFTRRWASNQPIFLHELLYPLAQGYDSVALKADVELGGTDQLFNLLVGRNLMREHGMEPQVVMTLPLLEGLDGVDKMSKSLGNTVGIEDPPDDMFGKVMSISDEMMWKWYTLLTDYSTPEIDRMRSSVESGDLHPMEAKMRLAGWLVKAFHSADDAAGARERFGKVFSERRIPEEMPEHTLSAEREYALGPMLKELGLCSSNSEARRLIGQGAVRIDSEKVEDAVLVLRAEAGRKMVIRVGKRRWARLKFE